MFPIPKKLYCYITKIKNLDLESRESLRESFRTWPMWWNTVALSNHIQGFLDQRTKQLSLFASTSFLHKAAAPVCVCVRSLRGQLQCMQRLDALSDDFVQKTNRPHPVQLFQCKNQHWKHSKASSPTTSDFPPNVMNQRLHLVLHSQSSLVAPESVTVSWSWD